MKYVQLGYRPETQVGVYASDEGHIRTICDESRSEMPAEWFTMEGAPKIYRMPPAAREITIHTAGNRLGDYPREPAWYYDPRYIRVTSVPLDRYVVDDWLFYARWLMAWGVYIWAVADPIDLRRWPDAT